MGDRERADVFPLPGRRLYRCRRASFAEFMAGRVPALAGETATLGDFADHITTAFTDVRLKRFLEMRGADAGRADMMLAQSALWVGLLYNDAALASAEALLRGAGWEDAIAARAAVPGRVWTRRGGAARCGISRGTWWRSPATGCAPAGCGTRRGMTSRCFWRRCRRSPRAARRRRKTGWRISMGHGGGMPAGFRGSRDLERPPLAAARQARPWRPVPPAPDGSPLHGIENPSRVPPDHPRSFPGSANPRHRRHRRNLEALGCCRSCAAHLSPP